MSCMPRIQLRYFWLYSLAAGLLEFAPFARAQHPSEDAIHQRLDEIVARPEFAPHQSGNWSSIWDKILEGLNWLDRLHFSAPLLYWTIIGLCFVALALLASHVGWTLWHALHLTPAKARSEHAAEKRSQMSLAFLEEASSSAERQEFTDAIRFLFLSLVYRFDESGRVLFQKAYTNREYLTLFADRPALQTDLKVFVDTLDDHWYGQQPTEPGQYEQCLGLYESMK